MLITSVVLVLCEILEEFPYFKTVFICAFVSHNLEELIEFYFSRLIFIDKRHKVFNFFK